MWICFHLNDQRLLPSWRVESAGVIEGKAESQMKRYFPQTSHFFRWVNSYRDYLRVLLRIWNWILEHFETISSGANEVLLPLSTRISLLWTSKIRTQTKKFKKTLRTLLHFRWAILPKNCIRYLDVQSWKTACFPTLEIRVYKGSKTSSTLFEIVTKCLKIQFHKSRK